MRYLIELFWSDEDKGWVAVVPDLPGWSALGSKPEYAAVEVKNAIEAWVIACRAADDPIPEPPSMSLLAA